MSGVTEPLDLLRRRLALCNRWALPLLIAAAIAAAVDAGLALAAVGRPVASVPPVSSGAGEPADLARFHLPAEVFQSASASAAAVPVSVSAGKTSLWKLKGIIFGADKRAFLEDADSKQTVWVREGDIVGDSKVRSIRDRSVELEKGGNVYEIRM